MKIARYLKKQGFVYPYRLVRAARRAGITVRLAVALVEQETGNGANVFGHDPVKPSQFRGGKVTRLRYYEYKRKRKKGLGMQGVGPCQLTWFTFQDEADRLGGCWHPYWNMVVGFRHLRAQIARNGRWAGIAAYNGSGPAAREYADSVQERYKKWTERFKKAGLL